MSNINIKEIEPTTIIGIILVLFVVSSFLYRLDMKPQIDYYESEMTFENCEIKSIENIVADNDLKCIVFEKDSILYKKLEYHWKIKDLKVGDKATFTVKVKDFINRTDEKKYNKLLEYERKSSLVSFVFGSSFTLLIINVIVLFVRASSGDDLEYNLANLYGVFLFLIVLVLLIFYISCL